MATGNEELLERLDVAVDELAGTPLGDDMAEVAQGLREAMELPPRAVSVQEEGLSRRCARTGCESAGTHAVYGITGRVWMCGSHAAVMHNARAAGRTIDVEGEAPIE